MLIKKVLGFIPARSGSKGIKNKNLQKIGKDTLVAKTIKISKKCKHRNNR